jgi:murein DD-endopeptidase MepM/ murein hydrolase activator NlpD
MIEASASPETPPTRRQLRRRGNVPVSAPATPVSVFTETTPHKRPARPKPSMGRRILGLGTVIAAPLLFVGVSLPVNIFYPSVELSPAVAGQGSMGGTDSGTQSFTVASSASGQVGVQRESWSVTSFAEVLKARYGSRNFSYSTTGNGSIRWPFPSTVPISSGFGDRVAPCRYCSSNHRGLDFTPGNGTPIFAIADGVVTQSEYGGGYGQYVYIEHLIGDQKVLSVYAHMQRGSSPVSAGQVVPAGEFLGLVGNTGISTGPHLHFEIRVEGEYVNPFTWLKLYAF